MYGDAIPLGTSWAADKTLQVVYPPQFATTKPKP